MPGSSPRMSQSILLLASQLRLHGYAFTHDDNQGNLGKRLVQFCREQADPVGKATASYDEIRYQASVSGSIAYSSSEMVPHTDGSFRIRAPKIVVLKCLTPDMPGNGMSILVDGYKVIDELAEDDVSILSTNEFFFRAPASEKEGIFSPVLDYRVGVVNIRFRYDQKYRPKSDLPEAEEAIQRLASLTLKPEFAECVALDENDVIIMDNSRIMHGRTRLSGRMERVILRAYFYAGSLYTQTSFP